MKNCTMCMGAIVVALVLAAVSMQGYSSDCQIVSAPACGPSKLLAVPFRHFSGFTRLRFRLRGGLERKRGRTEVDLDRGSSRIRKLLQKEASSEEEGDSTLKDERTSRFRAIIEATEKRQQELGRAGNVESERSEVDSSSLVTCPNCNTVHEQRNGSQRGDGLDSSRDASSDINVSSLLCGHVLDGGTRKYLAKLREDGDNEPKACEVIFQKCVDKNLLETAVSLYEEMRNRSLTPTFDSLEAVLDLCEQNSRWDVALALVQDVQQRGITPDEKLYLRVMKVCAKLEEWDVVVTLFEEMRAAALEQDSDCFSLALQALMHTGDCDRALAELARLKKTMQPTQHHFDSVIGVLLDAGRKAEAQAVIKESNELNAQLEREIVEEFSEASTDNIMSVNQACRELGEPEMASASIDEEEKRAEPEITYPGSDDSIEGQGDELDEDEENEEDEEVYDEREQDEDEES